MKALALALFTLITITLNAATPEQEKAFVDAYRKAFEASDKAALEGFLYTKGAKPDTIEMFKMMATMQAGQKGATIELSKLTKEESDKYNKQQPGPDGKMYKMPMPAAYKLSISIETKDENGSSKSSSSVPLIEKDGKFYIPVPVPAK